MNSDTARLNWILGPGYSWFHNYNYPYLLKYDNCAICQGIVRNAIDKAIENWKHPNLNNMQPEFEFVKVFGDGEEF